MDLLLCPVVLEPMKSYWKHLAGYRGGSAMESIFRNTMADINWREIEEMLL